MVGSSPGSPDGDDDLAGDHHEKKRQPGVKRACNECRQQKVSLTPSYSLPLARPPPAQIKQCPAMPNSPILLLLFLHNAANANRIHYAPLDPMQAVIHNQLLTSGHDPPRN